MSSLVTCATGENTFGDFVEGLYDDGVEKWKLNVLLRFSDMEINRRAKVRDTRLYLYGII